MSSRKRWPGWVFDDGEDPDYRFSLANERTFLAWIRTALALLAGGVGIDAINLSIPHSAQRALGCVLIVLGIVCAAASWARWAAAERAMRHDSSLPSSRLSALLAGVLIACALVVLVLVLVVV